MDQNLSSEFPGRQKFYIFLTVATGLFTIAAYYTTFMNYKNLYMLIWMYGLVVPVFLLSTELVVDLNNKYIFRIWLTIGLIFLVVYLSCRNSSTSATGWSNEYIDKAIIQSFAKEATYSLKALPIFLAAYRILNTIMKKKTGRYIVNIFKHYRPYTIAASRKIYPADILIHIILFSVTILGAVLKF